MEREPENLYMTGCKLYLDDHRGIYIPRDFVQGTKRECVSGVSDEDWAELLKGPPGGIYSGDKPNDNYWEIWDDVLNKAILDDGKQKWTLHQDGALFLIPLGLRWEVEMYTICTGWINSWRIIEPGGEDQPETFDSYEAAWDAIDEFLKEIDEAIKAGNRQTDEGYSWDDFRIVARDAHGQVHTAEE